MIEPKPGDIFQYSIGGDVAYCLIVERSESNLNDFFYHWHDTSSEDQYLFRNMPCDGKIYHRCIKQIYGLPVSAIILYLYYSM